MIGLVKGVTRQGEGYGWRAGADGRLRSRMQRTRVYAVVSGRVAWYRSRPVLGNRGYPEGWRSEIGRDQLRRRQRNPSLAPLDSG